jgi:hypothetical protein
MIEWWPRSSGEIIPHGPRHVPCPEIGRVPLFRFDQRNFQELCHWHSLLCSRRPIESGKFISNVGILNEAQSSGQRKQLMERSGKLRPAVEPIHLAFPQVRPEFSSGSWNSGIVLIVVRLSPVRCPEQIHAFNSTPPSNLRLRYQNVESASRWFLWLCGALIAVAWWRVAIPFWAKCTKDVYGVIRIDVSRSRSKFMELDGFFWWLSCWVCPRPLTFQRLRYCNVRYLRLSEHPGYSWRAWEHLDRFQWNHEACFGETEFIQHEYRAVCTGLFGEWPA